MKFQYRQNLRSLQILFVDLTQVLLTEMVEDDTKMLTIFICQYVNNKIHKIAKFIQHIKQSESK